MLRVCVSHYEPRPCRLPPPRTRRSTLKSTISTAQESFGELKKSIDAKSFNIFMTMVKEKMEGLKPYAQVV